MKKVLKKGNDLGLKSDIFFFGERLCLGGLLCRCQRRNIHFSCILHSAELSCLYYFLESLQIKM